MKAGRDTFGSLRACGAVRAPGRSSAWSDGAGQVDLVAQPGLQILQSFEHITADVTGWRRSGWAPTNPGRARRAWSSRTSGLALLGELVAPMWFIDGARFRSLRRNAAETTFYLNSLI